MSTVEQTVAAVEQAEQDQTKAHEEAERLAATVTDLERRIRNGDRGVTYKQLGEAEQKARHAALFFESHAASVKRARADHDQARLNEAGQETQAAQAALDDVLDRNVGVIVDRLAEVLGAVAATKDARQSLRARMSAVPIEHTEPPVGVMHEHSSPNRPYVPVLDVPGGTQLLGEIVGSAIDRAFDRPTKGTDMFRSSTRGHDVSQLFNEFIGSRIPGYQRRPHTYATANRLNTDAGR